MLQSFEGVGVGVGVDGVVGVVGALGDAVPFPPPHAVTATMTPMKTKMPMKSRSRSRGPPSRARSPARAESTAREPMVNVVLWQTRGAGALEKRVDGSVSRGPAQP
jgi:hypothetical protein